ncbi:MAG: GAF domain-containing protein [Chlorobi bacterium]|nr:GAF domain-containing protein [Chlorobiota bacterium]
MSEEIAIKNATGDKEIYEELFPQIRSLLSEDENVLSNMSNFIAAINQSFEKISWIGFYFKTEREKLTLGPFQGKTACTTITIGGGVCGTAAAERETVIVKDVNEFPGHIACDADSRSEIVVPLISKDELLGVLDLDSYDLAAFDEIDKFFLEKFVHEFISRFGAELKKMLSSISKL